MKRSRLTAAIVSASAAALLGGADARSVRGRGTRNDNARSTKRTASPTNHRPPIEDARRAEKIELWHARQRDERAGSPVEEREEQPRRRSLYSSASHHKKTGSYGDVSVRHVADPGFRTEPDVPAPLGSSGGAPPPPGPARLPSSPREIVSHSAPAGHSKGSAADPGGNSSSGGPTVYYPLFTPERQAGRCAADGQEPREYYDRSRSAYFLYRSPEDCCKQWYHDVAGCLEGFAFPVDGQLLKRNGETGKLAHYGEQQGMVANSVGEGSFEAIDVYDPNASSEDQNEEPASSAAGDSSSSSGGIPADEVFPTASPDTPWPTAVPTDGAAAVTNPGRGDVLTPSRHRGEVVFDESFESGDFNNYDWTLIASSQGMDTWEADMSATAYDGSYAARPGVLSVPGSSSTLEIDLEAYGLAGGGLLTFAVMAAVEMPVDRLTFRINDYVIRKFDRVSPHGDWEEVSILLLPGEHHLSWRYEYYGVPGLDGPEAEGYAMDPDRGGNSWLDGIQLRAFTDTVEFRDDGAPWELLSSSSGASWALAEDEDAYAGDRSYIAYTDDIVGNDGAAVLTWTIIAGPRGGVLSFAAFASVSAPHDLLEVAVHGVPEVALTWPSEEWETRSVELGPGQQVVTWRLVKNAPGLDPDLLRAVARPEHYEGWAKIDAVAYTDKAGLLPPTTTTSTTSERTTTTTEEPTTTTEEPTTTTEEPTTTTEEPTTTTEEPTTTTKATEVVTTTTTTTTKATELPKTDEMEQNFASNSGCLPGYYPVPGLPACCVEEPDFLGDGACDPWEPYNTAACAYDLGDCCPGSCAPDSAYGCDTEQGDTGSDGEEIGPFGFFCLDPRYSIIDEDKCAVADREWIGDGGCDSEGDYNTAECGWDMGDCCEETCDNDHSFYPCKNPDQPLVCLDPGVTVEQEVRSSIVSPLLRSAASPFYFHDGFENNVLAPPHWHTGLGGASWSVERDETGNHLAEARTEDIDANGGAATLRLTVSSPRGGTLSFLVMALHRAPHEDLVIKVDGAVHEVVSPAEGWQSLAVELTGGGEHVVEWVHRKNPALIDDASDSSASGSEGVSRVDEVTFTPI